MDYSAPVTQLKGVGPEIAKKLARLHIHTVGDILEYYPRRYDDYSSIKPISQLTPGRVTLRGLIKNVSSRYARRGLHITEAMVSDDTGSARLIWFNQPYRKNSLKIGTEYYISGDFQLRSQRLAIMNPAIELVNSFPVHTARILPVYRQIKGVSSLLLRKLIRESLPSLDRGGETLPAWLVKRRDLLPRADAVKGIHFPSNQKNLEDSKARLGFEEVFELSLAGLLNKYELSQDRAVSIFFDEALVRNFTKHLPFRLTDAQRKVTWQIYKDLERTQPMNRLVEGDVGSGKTVVAVMAALMVIKQGFQVALMAPTELLAKQHADTICELLSPLGMSDTVGLLAGSMKPAQKKQAIESISTGRMKFIVGTHAIIQEGVDMHSLGLVVVDEQHRFGVKQREALQSKAGHMPHILHMTATPIPRTLALTLYGELDVSIIDTKPEGRKPILTKIVSLNAREQLYKKIDLEVESGRQIFVVCPQIADSNDASHTKSVEAIYKELSESYFKHRRVGILHGRLSSDEKEDTMRKYVNGHLDILVSTTVIEVGVNVPNATIMVVEGAERFGLAQIHQLRGRVGRGSGQGYCYLIRSDSNAPGQRLKALESSSDGFRLAELDLEIRGPGAIYGTTQHGELDLRIARLSDMRLITSARKSAQEFLDKGEDLVQYKHLSAKVSSLRAITNLS